VTRQRNSVVDKSTLATVNHKMPKLESFSYIFCHYAILGHSCATFSTIPIENPYAKYYQSPLAHRHSQGLLEPSEGIDDEPAPVWRDLWLREISPRPVFHLPNILLINTPNKTYHSISYSLRKKCGLFIKLSLSPWCLAQLPLLPSSSGWNFKLKTTNCGAKKLV